MAEKLFIWKKDLVAKCMNWDFCKKDKSFDIVISKAVLRCQKDTPSNENKKRLTIIFVETVNSLQFVLYINSNKIITIMNSITNTDINNVQCGFIM